MLPFASDYMHGMHEAVLSALTRMHREPETGYGTDTYSARAREKLRRAMEAPQADIFFLSGGTQTNMVAISALLRPTEGVLSADTGHIEVHEAGAIEATGHKVLPLPSVDGKVSAQAVQHYCEHFYADETHTHMVFPGALYLSHPTEYGTLYTKAELTALREVCDRFGMRLYLDGARLGYALGTPSSDVTLRVLATLCDAFYVGGTKVGALCGEALVFPCGAPRDMLTYIKQRGALMAKGFAIGAQFDALFTDGLYVRIGQHAVAMAQRLKEAMLALGYPLYINSPTNQQFVTLTDAQYTFLSTKVSMSVWCPPENGKTVVRFATSWATTEEELFALISLLEQARALA